ncbi:hypothetical protein RHGRI_030844 [Rhododendron griersonianum]|uniref:Uncharacterized protein n=1 Tax=Rhododendron griersonianum TaxID=479676 RepID=A0AAV6I5J1_9ERIC|nr:hypothetical protein RHGRI_030844 [Rhododendron griersonianum]
MSKGNRIDWDKGNWRNQEMKQRQGVGMGNRSNGGNQNPKEVWIWRKKNVTRPQSNNLNHLPPIQFHHDRKAIWAKKIMSIKAKEVGNEWLHRSAIAKLSSTRPIVLIQDYLRNLGHAHVLVRTMGDDMVVLTFLDIAERDSMFNGGEDGLVEGMVCRITQMGRRKE